MLEAWLWCCYSRAPYIVLPLQQNVGHIAAPSFFLCLFDCLFLLFYFCLSVFISKFPLLLSPSIAVFPLLDYQSLP